MVDTLHCKILVLYCDEKGLPCGRKQGKKTSTITLGRDHRGHLSAYVELDENRLNFAMVGKVTVRGDCLREGRASIHLHTQGVTIQLTKADPDNLMSFCKLTAAKLAAAGKDRVTALQSPPDGAPPCKRVRHALGFNQISPPDEVQRGKMVSPAGKRKPAASAASHVSASRLHNARLGLSREQLAVMDAVLAGKSIFFTGNAGTGKTFLLKRIIDVLPKDTTFATASTGVAACATNGMTVHAFAGVQPGPFKMPRNIDHWLRARTLIIDEISMLDGRYFDQVEQLARTIRNSKLPFGGIQLILVGDFLQLPPVTKSGEIRTFAFEAKSWNACVQISMELTEIHRQADPLFANLLRRIRLGQCSAEDAEVIRATSSNIVEIDGIVATKLCTHVHEAEKINSDSLARLAGASKRFTSKDSVGAGDQQGLTLLSRCCRAPQELELKVGAQVMLIKNLDVTGGLANGSRGVVKRFESNGLPVVAFVNGREEVMRMQEWTVSTPTGRSYTRWQLPLQLAWAMSIHKSQGMSLDAVDVSLANTFEYGQAYVALSRARSLEGLRVRNFTPSCVRADPTVVQFYQQMASRKVSSTQG